MKGSPSKNLPAVATCQERGWVEGTVLCSARWSHPRRVESVKGPFVFMLSTLPAESPEQRQRRRDGTFLPGKIRGRLTRLERVRSLPPDVRRYYAATG
jgi:hypothetical protein